LEFLTAWALSGRLSAWSEREAELINRDHYADDTGPIALPAVRSRVWGETSQV